MSLQGQLFPSEKKIFVVTPSMISEYLRCPLRYKYIYIDGRKEKITKFYFKLGALIHNLLNLFYKTSSSLQTFEALKELLSEKWKSEWFETPEEEKEWFDRAIVMLKNFYHSHLSFKLKNFALELPFEVKIEDSDIILKGRIDRVVQDAQGNYHIIEYKIGHEEVAEDISMMEKNYQPIFYFLGLHNTFGLRAESFKYFFLLNNQTLTIQYTDSMLNKGIKELKNIIQEIRETKNYLPKENIYCQDCVFPCPLKPELKPIPNKEKKQGEKDEIWHKVIFEVRKKDPMLSNYLKISSVINLERKKICIVVPNKFVLERIREKMPFVRENFEKILKRKIEIDVQERRLL